MAEDRRSSVESLTPRAIAFEEYRFDLGGGRLWRGDEEIKLTPRAAAVLVVLVERAKQVVTKAELIEHAWDGKAVGDDALTSCVKELRRALGDDPHSPRFIETRHRRGYRWLVPVTSATTEASSPERAPSQSLQDKASIAVLPFQDLSDGGGQQYFADGVVDDIITALSRFRSLFVISRNSSFIYKGRAVDVKQVGRELGVRYVLEGSVRKAANRLRVTAQLIDTATGSHIWADRLEGALEAVFELQDQITEKVVTIIAPKVEEAEIARVRRRPSRNLDAYDCCLRGAALLLPATKQGNAEALRLFKRAIELDPDYAAPFGLMMVCYGNLRVYGWVDDPEREKEEVRHLLQTVIQVGRDDALVLSNTAWTVAYVLHDLPSARGLIDQALDLNPNLARAWGNSGWINLWLGHPDVAAEHFRRALRHDPHGNVYTSGLREGMAHACFFLGRHDEALSWAESELQRRPEAHAARRIGAASAAHAGKFEVARSLGLQLQSVDHLFRVSRLGEYLGPYQKLEFVAKYAEGLRMAGLPE